MILGIHRGGKKHSKSSPAVASCKFQMLDFIFKMEKPRHFPSSLLFYQLEILIIFLLFCIALERNSDQTSESSWYFEVFGKALSEEGNRTNLHLI